MVMKFSKNNLNKKRGISTIIGGMIFLVLLTAGFSTFFLAMDVQTDTINAQLSVSDSVIKKTQEQFDIAVATDESNNYQLGIQVKNKGPNPLEISDIWIVNKSLATQPAIKIAVNYSDAFLPPGYGSSILENQILTMTPDEYDIKVISTLGTIKKAELSVGGNNYLLAEMFTIPPDVRQNENVTIALRVTNVGPTTITGVTPDNEPPINDNPTWVGATQLVSPVPVDLEPSESTIFSWHTTLTGVGLPGNKLQFTDSASGTESLTGFNVQSNTAYDKITVRDDDDGGSEGEEIVVKDELFGRPKIFMIFPGPVGTDADDRALWGVNVVNPTDQPMNVSKVTILAFSPRATSSDKIFKDVCQGAGAPSSPLAITPFTATVDWTCPESNQLVWSGSSPITIQPRSTHPFLVEIGAHSYDSGSADTGHVIIQAIAFTDLGQFGKSGYAASIFKDNIAMPNVFLSKVNNQATSALSGNILGNITAITEGTEVTFNAVIVDMSDTEDNGINVNSKLIINIPKDWTYNIGSGIVSSTNINIIKEQAYPDGSTQIVGKIDSHIDERDEARIIEFKATAPAVSSTKMYIMHILGEGTVTGVGVVPSMDPLAEIVLQVCPTTGCLP